MKKDYISPQTIVLDIESEQLLTASNFEIMDSEEVNIWREIGEDPQNALSKEHSGIWDE